MAAYDVFLSYARPDSERAALVRAKLEALGLSVFFDAEGIDSGEEFPVVIDRAVKNARCVLGLWSRAAFESRWVRIESRIGLDQRKLVAAMLDATRPSDLPAEFYNVNFESLADFAGQDDHAGWRRVLRALGNRLGKRLVADAPAPQTPAPAPSANRNGWAIGLGLAALGAGAIFLSQREPNVAPAPRGADAFAPAIPVPLGAPAAADLSGRWAGEYWGPNAQRASFVMDLQGVPGVFSGRLEETNVFVIGGPPTLTAAIQGETRADGGVRFSKTYDGASGISHSVEYEGRFDQLGAIVGTWRAGANSGEFRIARAN